MDCSTVLLPHALKSTLAYILYGAFPSLTLAYVDAQLHTYTFLHAGRAHTPRKHSTHTRMHTYRTLHSRVHSLTHNMHTLYFVCRQWCPEAVVHALSPYPPVVGRMEMGLGWTHMRQA